MTLMAIMRESPDLAKRIEEGTKEVKQNKAHLMANAAEYAEIYHKEIEEGTKKRQLLLEYGKKHGKDEPAVLAEYGKFIPSRGTPIMNFIYFLMRDGNHPDWVGIYKKLDSDYGHVDTKKSNVVSEEELEQIYGMLVHEEEQYINVKEPKNSDYYIYGNMTHDMFVKIKKLKTLSRSDNEHEATVAYRLAIKLCKKYGLEFDKIPCFVENDADTHAPWG